MSFQENDFSQILALQNGLSQLSLGKGLPPREPGMLMRVQMPWQLNRETLFQFKQIYIDRIKTLRTAFKTQSNMTIEDLSSEQNGCEIVGLFKRIQEKRIRAFEPQFNHKYQNHKPLYTENDTYQLEDQTGRVRLSITSYTKFNDLAGYIFKPLKTPYGVIIKCRGKYSPQLNRFLLSNVESPKPAPQQPMVLPKNTSSKFMVVLCQPTTSDLNRFLGMIANSDSFISKDVRQLVIIGGLSLKDLSQIRQFDQVLSKIKVKVDTFFVPSSGQQTSYMYPLQPLHRSVLQKSLENKDLGNCSNPQILVSKIQGVRLNAFISCGQNLLNLKVNCKVQDDLKLMEMIIQYRHICPSSVFSLPIQSYKYDPLILKQTPHIMVHGKCAYFKTDFRQSSDSNGKIVNVRLVALARGEAATIDLSSKKLQTLFFQL